MFRSICLVQFCNRWAPPRAATASCIQVPPRRDFPRHPWRYDPPNAMEVFSELHVDATNPAPPHGRRHWRRLAESHQKATQRATRASKPTGAPPPPHGAAVRPTRSRRRGRYIFYWLSETAANGQSGFCPTRAVDFGSSPLPEAPRVRQRARLTLRD